jgi:DNA invertase Pin-like site-specific DNA recombinase
LPRFDPTKLRRELLARGLTATRAAELAHVNHQTMRRALRGEEVRWESARAIRDMLRAHPPQTDADFGDLLTSE